MLLSSALSTAPCQPGYWSASSCCDQDQHGPFRAADARCACPLLGALYPLRTPGRTAQWSVQTTVPNSGDISVISARDVCTHYTFDLRLLQRCAPPSALSRVCIGLLTSEVYKTPAQGPREEKNGGCQRQPLNSHNEFRQPVSQPPVD